LKPQWDKETEREPRNLHLLATKGNWPQINTRKKKKEKESNEKELPTFDQKLLNNSTNVLPTF